MEELSSINKTNGIMNGRIRGPFRIIYAKIRMIIVKAEMYPRWIISVTENTFWGQYVTYLLLENRDLSRDRPIIIIVEWSTLYQSTSFWIYIRYQLNNCVLEQFCFNRQYHRSRTEFRLKKELLIWDQNNEPHYSRTLEEFNRCSLLTFS